MLLIDKGPLPNPGGSTGHASNFILFPVDNGKPLAQLTMDSKKQYAELGVERICGGIEVARTDASVVQNGAISFTDSLKLSIRSIYPYQVGFRRMSTCKLLRKNLTHELFSQAEPCHVKSHLMLTTCIVFFPKRASS
jgi:hypothetical protein